MIADDALIVDVARGDRNALSQLYDRHVGVMMALAHRIHDVITPPELRGRYR